jgi:hypothetical protein
MSHLVASQSHLVTQTWGGYKLDKIFCNKATKVNLAKNLKLGTYTSLPRLTY